MVRESVVNSPVARTIILSDAAWTPSFRPIADLEMKELTAISY
jgi:hypothetical protein